MKFPISFFLMKTTGYLVDKILNRRKIYYEDKYKQSRTIKGPAIIVSNHKDFKDYIAYFFTFFFKKIYVVTGDIFYRQNPFLNLVLKIVGGIRISSENFDLGFVEESEKLLRKGKTVLIFPEGHYEKDDELLRFSSTFVKMALDTGAPIIPTYTDGNYIKKVRNRVVVGEKIYLSDYCTSKNPSAEELERLSNIVKDKILELKKLKDIRKANPTFSFKYFFMDLGRVLERILFWPFFIYKIHSEEKGEKPIKIYGRYLIAANHRSFQDPLICLNTFWRRRVYILTAKEVFEDKKIRTKLLTEIGCIKIDRDIFDFEAISNCAEKLNEEKAIVVFPEGHINRVEPSLEMLKRGIGLLSVQTSSRILPIYICNRKNYFKRVHIFVGKPINPKDIKYSTFNDMAKVGELTRDLQSAIVVLRQLAIKEGYENE